MTNRVLRFGQVRFAMLTVSVQHCFGQTASLTRYTVCSCRLAYLVCCDKTNTGTMELCPPSSKKLRRVSTGDRDGVHAKCLLWL